jgi:hypothetical protein
LFLGTPLFASFPHGMRLKRTRSRKPILREPKSKRGDPNEMPEGSSNHPLRGRRTSWTDPCDRFSRSVWAKALAKDGRVQSRLGKGGNALSAHPVTVRPLSKTAWPAGPRC